ncbi:S9 family peptidase [candidate division KSB1 bacterium]|nr:S9 family peptidase [candidate division KSB1 bacterium]
MMPTFRQMKFMFLISTMLVSLTAANATTRQTESEDRKPVTPKDYGKWETLSRGALSPDGNWLIYSIRRNNDKNELRLHNLKDESQKVLAQGTNPEFSKDSQWLGYLIEVSAEESKKLKKKKKPVHTKFGLLGLASEDSAVIKDVASFAFSGNSQFVAMKHYALKGKKSKGADLVVRDLQTGRDFNFGNVSEYQWREEGAQLALIIDAEGQAGNGIQLFNAATGQLKILDSKAAEYKGLTWRKKGDDLAAFRVEKNEDYEDSTHVIIAWQKLAGKAPVANIFDPEKIEGFPTATRIVNTRQLEWTKDGKSLFFATKEWQKKPPKVDEAKDDSTKTENPDSVKIEEPPDLQIWHSKDVRIIPEQQQRAEKRREDAHLAVWHIKENKFVQLGDDLTERTRVQDDIAIVLGLDSTPYEFEGMFGRPKFDAYAIDIHSGEKQKFLMRVNHLYSISPDGKNIVYLKDDHYHTYNFKSAKDRNLTADIGVSFVNKEDDHPVEQKPPYRFVAWAKDGKSFFANAKYDVWQLWADGSKSRKVTDGEAEKVIHRYVRLDPEEETIDVKKPMYLSLYGEWSKKYGYASVIPGKEPKNLVWQEANVANLIKAKKAKTFAYVIQNFDDSPDYFVAPRDFAKSKQVSNTNPFQKDYAWGKSELIEYTNANGRKLQGALFYPADYQPGEKYPMITYIYEIRSHMVRRYAVPSQRNYYNHSVFTSEGYFVLQPDIVFDSGDPGISSVRTIEIAVKKVIDMGLVDEKRIGLAGHSWGGYQAAFAVTQTDIFAAAIAGAGLTDFFSMYGMVGWAFGGTPENLHFEVSQERMMKPPWKDIDGYVRNSPVMNVENLNTPLLFEVGDNDRNVDWRQGIEYYNAARREGKQMVLLVYAKEGHSLRQDKNRIDYHRRILHWFGHYLKDEPAEQWIESGIPYLEQQRLLKNWKKN